MIRTDVFSCAIAYQETNLVQDQIRNNVIQVNGFHPTHMRFHGFIHGTYQ